MTAICARCGLAFDPDENPPRVCEYHPGRLRDYDRLGAEGIVGCPGDFWDCCKKQYGQDDPIVGCKRGRHIPAIS